jgi:hypothetical protein
MVVHPDSGRISRVRPYLGTLYRQSLFRVRGYHPLWPSFPACSTIASIYSVYRLIRFRSPLLTESRLISFPLGTEMFQFPRFRLKASFHDTLIAYRVPPFRYPRINACCQLPGAFRRLPRLSSPLTAKASTQCAYLLDPIALLQGFQCLSDLLLPGLCKKTT